MNFYKCILRGSTAGALSRLGKRTRRRRFHGEVSDSQCALNVHSLDPLSSGNAQVEVHGRHFEYLFGVLH